MTGLMKVLPAPERATLLLALFELQALRVLSTATASIAAHPCFRMKILPGV
jgi:hypothetical protein